MNGCRNILPVVALLLALAACGHGGMAEQAARAAVDTVEAHYKAYATVEADLPLIDEADHRLDRRGVDRRTRVRAALYHGAVLDELGRADSALIHYKRAEAACDTADHDLLGYINLRIASLYQNSFCVDTTAVHRYRRALRHYTIAEDEHYRMVCLGAIGNEYSLYRPDSAVLYLDSALEIASKLDDKKIILLNKLRKAENQFQRKEYKAAKFSAEDVITQGGDSILGNRRAHAILVQSLALLGKPDSARLFLARMPVQNSPADSISYFDALTEIARAENNFPAFAQAIQKSADIGGNSLINSLQIKLSEAEKRYDFQLLENRSIRNQRTLSVVVLLVVLLTMAVMLLFYANKRKERKLLSREMTIAQLKNDVETMSRVKTDNQKLRDVIQAQVKAVSGIVELAQAVNRGSMDKEFFYRRVKEAVSVDKSDIEFWTEIQSFADLTHNNLITKAKEDCPTLKESDLRLLSLMCCDLPATSIMFCMGYNDIHSLYNKKRRVTQKLGIRHNLDEFVASCARNKR
ncbi:MAG: hypothetical protein J6N71_02295 [Muribaculaceae bacterium]|nr:hypothetical protein [Muribaculaceae bacterium]